MSNFVLFEQAQSLSSTADDEVPNVLAKNDVSIIIKRDHCKITLFQCWEGRMDTKINLLYAHQILAIAK